MDCLAATGGAGIDPIVLFAGLTLLLVGGAVLAWRWRKRGSVALALLPLAFGLMLFGSTATPAQAAVCPPAACVPTTVIEPLSLEALALDISTFNGVPSVEVITDFTEEEQAEVEAFSDSGTIDPAGFDTVTYTGVDGSLTLAVNSQNGAVVDTVPAGLLPDDFDAQDVWDLIEETTGESEDVAAVLVSILVYENGCGSATSTFTLTGTWSYPNG